ncbi:MAG: acyltransferase [Terracidiphilus sp.]|jgi:surface polysaccharide O-acyltransferase-like enzyme
MRDSGNISARIEILRFPLIAGVVFIHSYNSTITMAQGSLGAAHSSAWADFVRFFLSQGVARAAVPLFFLISGYLFFLGEWSWGNYLGKLKRRVGTLLIPFLFWNLTALAIYSAGRCLPQTRIYFAGGAWPPAGPFSIFGYLGALFGVTTRQPLCYPFWFIRDLMVLVLLAFAIHFLIRIKWALPFLIALSGLWFASAWFAAAWPFLWPSVEAAFFFSLGAHLAQPGRNVNCLDNLGPWNGAVFLGLLILNSAYPDGPLYLRRCAIVFGVPSLWWLTGLAARSAKIKSTLISLSGASFFVFAAHEPLLMILRKLCYKLLSPSGGAEILALYFLIPFCMMAFLVITHRYLLKIMPRFIGLITGSGFRTKQQRG